jgi:cystathionine beta-lyase
LAPAEGTYLAWLRVDARLTGGEAASDLIRRRAGMLVDEGAGYGTDDQHWIRMNLACPRAMLAEALERFRFALLP